MKPVRVLIIEDNLDGADSMQVLLDLLGYDTKVAYTGVDGLRLARSWCPDVVLCDLGLPGVTGYEIAQALKGCPDTSHVRLVAISGYGSPEAREQAMASGFDHHFTKPADPAAVLNIIPRPAR